MFRVIRTSQTADSRAKQDPLLRPARRPSGQGKFKVWRRDSPQVFQGWYLRKWWRVF